MSHVHVHVHVHVYVHVHVHVACGGDADGHADGARAALHDGARAAKLHDMTA